MHDGNYLQCAEAPGYNIAAGQTSNGAGAGKTSVRLFGIFQTLFSHCFMYLHCKHLPAVSNVTLGGGYGWQSSIDLMDCILLANQAELME